MQEFLLVIRHRIEYLFLFLKGQYVYFALLRRINHHLWYFFLIGE